MPSSDSRQTVVPSPLPSAGPVDPETLDDLVAANRILAEQGVLDAFGHVSQRHPNNPDRYLLARNMAPELVTAGDIMEFDLDSNPVDPRGRRVFLERFIHGEIYKVRPDVGSVIHTHSPSIVPFSISTVPLPLCTMVPALFRAPISLRELLPLSFGTAQLP